MSMSRSILEKIKISKKENRDNPKESSESGQKEPGREPAAMPAGREYQIGDRIAGSYEIHRILGGEGKSGMGVVYVCYDHKFKQVLALKTFQNKYLTSKEAKDSFKKEALAWVRLDSHAFIVKADWVQELDYRMFVGAEFIAPDDEGRNTLSHYLNRPISLKQALTWCIQFCHGMEYAFEKGVTPHRDIKPDNIMITQDGVLKITDFGLAGIWEGADLSPDAGEWSSKENKGLSFIRNAGGKFIGGTPPWMAPEQFEGQADVRSDIYSFGIVMCQMINRGALPFWAQPGFEWSEAHRTQQVPKVDSALFPIVQRCLHKEAGKRYPEFRELRKALEHLFNKEITSKTGEAIPLPPETAKLEAWELVNKGVSLSNLGLVDEAIAIFREVIRINPEDAVVHLNLGAALKAKGLVDEAIARYREAIRINPECAEAHYNLGVALGDNGLVDGAIASYQDAIRTNPEYALAHVNLGIALKAKGLVDEAIASYREAIRINPECAEAHYNLGVALQDNGLVDGAIASYRQAIRNNPEFAEAHVNLGAALKAKGLVDEAIASYRQAIRNNPEDAGAHYNLGLALETKGLIDEAIACYRKAIRINPEYAEAHFNLGNVLLSKDLFDEAIASYQEAIRIDPENAGAYFHLGFSQYSKGLIEDAIDSFNESIRIKPVFASTHYALGVALRNKGLLNDSIDCWRKTITIDPKFAPAHMNLGVAFKEKGLLEEAIISLQETVKIDPKNANAYFELGNAFWAKGLLDQAIAAFHEVIRINPKDAEAHCNIGDIFRNKGLFAEAVAAYEGFVACAPPQYAQHIESAKAKIRELKSKI